MAEVKRRMQAELPELAAYFSSGSMVDSVLNMGMPAPIDVQVSGSDLAVDYDLARALSAVADRPRTRALSLLVTRPGRMQTVRSRAARSAERTLGRWPSSTLRTVVAGPLHQSEQIISIGRSDARTIPREYQVTEGTAGLLGGGGEELTVRIRDGRVEFHAHLQWIS
jgi:hypothetical protein